jgi:hypothetical protein
VRKLIGLILVLAVIVGGLAIADHVVKDKVQSVLASRIQKELPGSDAQVKITSFPFLGHLAVSGTVPQIQADVDNVSSGDIQFSSIRMTITDLKIKRNDLFSGKVTPLSIKRGRVVATVPASTIDSISKLPLTLGAGTVSAAGQTVPAHLSISGDTVTFSASGLTSFSLAVPALDVLPCVDSARIVTGAVRLTCRFTSLPKVLASSLHV